DGRADLPGAAILMVPWYRSFDPEDPTLRLVDLARLGLRGGRQVLSDEVMRDILDGKFRDPMLGLFGAHLLLLWQQQSAGQRPRKASAEAPTLGRRPTDGLTLAGVDEYLHGLYGKGVAFGTVVEDLRRLFGRGRHPDVEALALLLDPSG